MNTTLMNASLKKHSTNMAESQVSSTRRVRNQPHTHFPRPPSLDHQHHHLSLEGPTFSLPFSDTHIGAQQRSFRSFFFVYHQFLQTSIYPKWKEKKPSIFNSLTTLTVFTLSPPPFPIDTSIHYLRLTSINLRSSSPHHIIIIIVIFLFSTFYPFQDSALCTLKTREMPLMPSMPWTAVNGVPEDVN